MFIRRNIRVDGSCIAGIVLMLALVPVGICQTDPVEEAEPESSDIPEEIVVYGKKNIVNLRYAVYTAEDNFFAGYGGRGYGCRC